MNKKQKLLKKIVSEIKTIPNDLKKEIQEFKILAKDIQKEGKKEFAEIKKKKQYWKQIPNVLTASRAIAPFVVLTLILFHANPIAIIATSAGFALTDFLDGQIARIFNAQSKLGVSLDQFCDKIMAGGLGLIFLPYNLLISITLLLELVIAKVAITSSIESGNNKSQMIGRIKTWFLFATIIGAFASFYNIIPKVLFHILFGASSILQIASIQAYYQLGKNTSDKKKEIKNPSIPEIDEQDQQLVHEKQKTSEQIKQLLEIEKEILLQAKNQQPTILEKEEIKDGHVKTIRKH